MAPPFHTTRSTPNASLRSRLLHRFFTALTMPPTGPAVTLRLIGTPALLPPNDAVTALERKDAALLALLATAGATPRASLAALLWPDVDDEGARNNLRQRLFRLKHAVGHDLVAGGNVLSLAEGVVHDLASLPARLAADPEAMPGELLGAFDYSDVPELAAWVDVAREQWRAARRDALAETAARLEGERQIAEALRYALRLVADDPPQEHAHRRVMRLHYLRGDRTAALAAYEHARAVLARELGVAPGQETETLAALIRSGGATQDVQATRPAAVLRPPRLVGREPEWLRLQDAAASRRSVLVCGEAGIGKTRLLTDFAAHHGAAAVFGSRPGDARVPYVLLARMMRGLAQQISAPRVDWAASELARIAPEFGIAPTVPLDVLRLQQAVAALLTQWHAEGLMLIALDDLHFADEASLEMLPDLTNASGAALAWLLTMRAGETPGALSLWCAAQDTEGPIVMTLGPLDVQAIRALLESLALPEIDAAQWAAPLARHTGGNPMFILETLIAMLAEGPVSRSGADVVLPAPVSVGQLVERRLEQLPAPALKLARVAAIAGADLSVALAAAVLGQDALGIADAWHQLEAAQVMRDHGFAHDLIREATLRSVPAAIAKVMHGEVAAHLQAQGAATARIAQHWFEAQEFARAGTQFRRAADEALAASRHDEQAMLLARSADCLEQQSAIASRR